MAKEFQLTHIFKKVSEFKDGECRCGPLEEHFNVEWLLYINRKDDELAVFLGCNSLQGTEETTLSIYVELKFTLKNSIGTRVTKIAKCLLSNKSTESDFGLNKFIGWETLLKDYLIDDSIIIEAKIKITKMTGFPRKELRSFDESSEEYSDMIIAVGDRKFYVLKQLLASNSTHFQSLIPLDFEEMDCEGKSEITLPDINPSDFQCLLEVLYGEPAMDDENVEGILHSAHMYKMTKVIRNCEEFLSNKSEKPMRDKFKIAKQYQLESLKKSCLSKIQTIQDIKSAMAGDLSDMDATVVAALLEKSVTIEPPSKNGRPY
ncbi:BTB and MATH domain containing [Caenorhabditis elegans]|uniref:BTB and MATH domain containing n=1 Tax=Caenorhabditis elegans TaxID=6239 RepID=Q9TYJ1_CAEEL|nr:BTB and MATH domain containing [Caenorhabditis elegans]CCD69499.1 BTB and MATH domain containing [Caenorhabditis elegans]|eukprot:NP_494523.1 BTB and MATH domain containing [Caenorhabditis elegans]